MIAVVALAIGVAALFVLCFVWMTEIICDAQRRIDARDVDGTNV